MHRMWRRKKLSIVIPLGVLLASASISANAATSTSIWKEWYLLSVNGKPTGFYEETAEKRGADKQVAVTQRWVEREGGLTETYIGAVAADDGKLTPAAFFRERKVSGKEEKVDGRVKDGNLEITIKAASGLKEKKSVLIKNGMILSNTLSLALAGKKAGKDPFVFQAIVEDVRDGNYDPMEGAALISDTTKKFGGLNCHKVTVEFHGQAEWWIAPNGKVCEIISPANGARITLTSEKEAKKALGIK